MQKSLQHLTRSTLPHTIKKVFMCLCNVLVCDDDARQVQLRERDVRYGIVVYLHDGLKCDRTRTRYEFCCRDCACVRV